MTDTEKTNKSPEYKVFSVIKAFENSTRKKQVGVAWKHKTGEGFNIVLDLMPIPNEGKVELVVFPVNKDM